VGRATAGNSVPSNHAGRFELPIVRALSLSDVSRRLNVGILSFSPQVQEPGFLANNR
jgi:hypothetical protein